MKRNFEVCLIKEGLNIDGTTFTKDTILSIVDALDGTFPELVFYHGTEKTRIKIGKAKLEKFFNGELLINVTILPEEEAK